MRYAKIVRQVLCYFLLFTFLSGCALVIQKGRRSDLTKIKTLKGEVSALERELSELRNAKSLLEGKLSQEIKDKQVKLDMQERGLVITVLGEILFDSGKDVLRKESYSILDKILDILKDELREHRIGVEGHTDNQPIKYSAWKSNWELSSHRALSVLYYLKDNGVKPDRLSAIGYGEYRPVASNDTQEGRQLNRRVEIVILPRLVKKLELEDVDLEESEELLK
ncbi:MAG: OmpA family protein [Candidatus Omnitrophica bacterium]|nr:OmpA family protein [Candidatus Omnitrophota bacterium]